MPKKTPAKRAYTRRKPVATSIDPNLHALLSTHYRLSGLTANMDSVLARMSALIDAKMPSPLAV